MLCTSLATCLSLDMSLLIFPLTNTCMHAHTHAPPGHAWAIWLSLFGFSFILCDPLTPEPPQGSGRRRHTLSLLRRHGLGFVALYGEHEQLEFECKLKYPTLLQLQSFYGSTWECGSSVLFTRCFNQSLSCFCFTQNKTVIYIAWVY